MMQIDQDLKSLLSDFSNISAATQELVGGNLKGDGGEGE
jgi:hypothetical protein